MPFSEGVSTHKTTFQDLKDETKSWKKAHCVLRESETILMNEAAATIYTRLTATAESLLIMYTKS